MSEHSSVHVALSRNTERSDPVLNHLVTVTDRHQVGAGLPLGAAIIARRP